MQTHDDADVGTIARELYIEAAPETVYDVVSRPEHVAQWWPDTAAYDVEVGASGEITFGDPEADGARVALTVRAAIDASCAARAYQPVGTPHGPNAPGDGRIPAFRVVWGPMRPFTRPDERAAPGVASPRNSQGVLRAAARSRPAPSGPGSRPG